MATPITWRNIQDLSGIRTAANITRDAGQSITRGLGQIQSAGEDILQTNRDQNTAAFQDAIAQYQSPEELEAAMESGAIERLKSQYGGQIDRDVARDGAQNLLEGRRAEEVAENAFDQSRLDLEDSLAKRAAKPIVQRLEALALSDDPADQVLFEQEMAENKEALVASDDWSRLTKFGVDREQSEEDRAQTLRERDNRNEDRARLERERKLTDRTENMLREYRGKATRLRADRPVEFGKLATKHGIADENGNPLQATPEQYSAFDAAVNKFMASQPGTAELRQRLMTDLDEDPNMTEAIRAAALSAFDANAESMYNYLSPEQKAEKAKEEATALRRYSPQSNAFVAADRSEVPVDQAVQEEITRLVGSGDEDNPSEFAQVMNSYSNVDPNRKARITNQLLEAVTIGVQKSDGTVKKITPSMIGLAMRGFTEADWLKFNERSVESLLEDFVDSPAYKQQEADYNGYIAAKSAITSKYSDPALAAFSSRLNTFRPRPTIAASGNNTEAGASAFDEASSRAQGRPSNQTRSSIRNQQIAAVEKQQSIKERANALDDELTANRQDAEREEFIKEGNMRLTGDRNISLTEAFDTLKSMNRNERIRWFKQNGVEDSKRLFNTLNSHITKYQRNRK